MHQHQAFAALASLDPDQFIGVTLTERDVARHPRQFLVQKLVSGFPVDPAVRVREEKSHEFREKPFQQLFPGTVVVVASFGHRPLPSPTVVLALISCNLSP